MNARDLGTHLGWSQHRMAAYPGCHQATVSRIENGHALSGPIARLRMLLVGDVRGALHGCPEVPPICHPGAAPSSFRLERSAEPGPHDRNDAAIIARPRASLEPSRRNRRDHHDRPLDDGLGAP